MSNARRVACDNCSRFIFFWETIKSLKYNLHSDKIWILNGFSRSLSISLSISFYAQSAMIYVAWEEGAGDACRWFFKLDYVCLAAPLPISLSLFLYSVCCIFLERFACNSVQGSRLLQLISDLANIRRKIWRDLSTLSTCCCSLSKQSSEGKSGGESR